MMQAVGEGHSAITQDLFPLKTTLKSNALHQPRSGFKMQRNFLVLMKNCQPKFWTGRANFHQHIIRYC